MTTNAVNESEPKTGNRARVRRYRAVHKRIDFVPAADVLATIERHLALGLDNCLCGVVDRLVRAGDKAISGNGRGS